MKKYDAHYRSSTYKKGPPLQKVETLAKYKQLQIIFYQQ